MSISTKLEYWNEAPDPDSVHVFVHPRHAFYGIDSDVCWYSFAIDGTPLHELGCEDMIPKGFLRVPDTEYYEFGGTSEEAIKCLTNNGFTLIVNGDEL